MARSRDWTTLLRLTATDFNYRKELYGLPLDTEAAKFKSLGRHSDVRTRAGDVESEKGKKVASVN